MSLLSHLSRGTGTVEGVIVGEGFEPLGDYLSASYPGTTKQEVTETKVPATYLTRRGNLMLYTRPDVPPRWEDKVLANYKSMGSLVSGMETVILNKEEKRKDMDRRCVPGRPINPYLGLLKNNLLCSDTVKALRHAVELQVSSTGSFPKQWLSPGLELVPEQLEEMGVNIAEFLQGKGSCSHLIPPLQVSHMLPRVSTQQDAFGLDAVDSTVADSSLPTPAPPQSPLPEDTNQNRSGGRAAKSRRSSARAAGSARSTGPASEIDSAYGTKSVDMSTIRSETPHKADARRDGVQDEEKPLAMPPIFNNSSEYVRSERPLFWMPEVSEATQSVSVEDVDPLQTDVVNDFGSVNTPAEEVAQTDLRPAQIRTAQWVNQNVDSLMSSATIQMIREDSETPKVSHFSRQSEHFESNQPHTLAPTLDESFSELRRLQAPRTEREDTISMGDTLLTATETSQNGVTLEAVSSKEFGTRRTIAAENTESYAVTETGNKSVYTSDLESTEAVREAQRKVLWNESSDLMSIQAYRAVPAPSDERQAHLHSGKTARSVGSHPTSAVSSISLTEEVATGFPDRNASNVFGTSWEAQLADAAGSLMESGLGAESFLTTELSQSDSKLLSVSDVPFSSKPAGDAAAARPASALSIATSGADIHDASTTLSADPHPDLAKAEPAPLLARASPVADRLPPALHVTAPSPRPQEAAAAPPQDLPSPRPSSSRRSRPVSAREPSTQPAARTKTKSPTKPVRRPKSQTARPRRAPRTKPDAGKTKEEKDPPPELGEEEMARIEAERAALQAAAAAEKERRLAQAAELQDKIKAAEESRLEAEREAERRRREAEAELRSLAAEEETMRLMEEEARQQMMKARKEAREARELRRKNDLERRKEEIRRRREEDLRRQEAAGEREREMLERLGDASLRRRVAEDAAARRAQQLRELEERLAEEEAAAAERARAEEERMDEFERLAEEEAVARLLEDMDEVEERRRAVRSRVDALDREKEERRLAALAEERRLAEERKEQEEMERRRREEEEQARIKLALEEDELRRRLELEDELQQQEQMRRREHNLEMRTDHQHLVHRQQINRPWVFSYFVHWPRESFERPIGGDAAKPKRFRFPAKSSTTKKSDSLPPL